jgi:hypothetical protein
VNSRKGESVGQTARGPGLGGILMGVEKVLPIDGTILKAALRIDRLDVIFFCSEYDLRIESAMNHPFHLMNTSSNCLNRIKIAPSMHSLGPNVESNGGRYLVPIGKILQ